MIIDDFYINYNIAFVTPRYLATGDAITTIAYNFWMGVSTARQIILDVCTATQKLKSCVNCICKWFLVQTWVLA